MRAYSAASAVLVLAASVLACRSAAASFPLRAPAPDSNAVSTGVKLYEQGKYVEAADTLKGQKGVEANSYYAAALVKQKKYADAEAPAKDAIAEDPGSTVAAAALGESLVAQKKYDDAVDRLSAVIKAKPDMAYAYYWRGQAYQGKKRPDLTIADFDTFLKLAPDAPEAPVVRQTLAALR